MEIRFSQNALSDLHAVYDYIALENPDYAQKVLKRIEVAVDRLADHPQLGRVSRVEGVRELIISNTPYIVAYKKFEGCLNIIAVIHSSRKLTAILH